MDDLPSADFGGDDSPLSPPADGETKESDQRSHGVETKAQEEIFVPARVKLALEGAKSFDDFRNRRPFKFLHLYSGPNDPLSEAIKIEGAKQRLQVETKSLDKKIDATVDLAKPRIFELTTHDVEQGEWDFVHSGFPCGSFSRARHNDVPGQPKAVRNKEFIYGLPGNSRQQQDEADRGTHMACQSGKIYETQIAACKRRKVPPLGSMENPPGDEVSGSAWDLPELQGALQRTGGSMARYNTCAYMSREKVRFYKPGVWAGKLEDISKLQKVCLCPAWVSHLTLVGKDRTERAAEYTRELAEAVAVQVVAVWKKTLNLEWWRHLAETKSQEVNQLQKEWLKNEEKKTEGSKTTSSGTKRAASIAFKIDNIEEDNIPSGSKGPDKKRLKEEHNKNAIGGMRNPTQSVKRLAIVRDTGKRMWTWWAEFVESHPECLDVAMKYGQAENCFNEDLVQQWRQVLKDHFTKIPDEDRTLVTKENWEFNSPLDADLWEQWQRESKDPEVHLADFARRGAPMGMEVEIPESGVFPPSLEEDTTLTDPAEEFENLRWVKNYSSVRDQQSEATIEIERYLEKGFVKRMKWSWIETRFGRGTCSKMALIVKQKTDGSTKRRIVLDLRRSQGNDRARVKERIILPRLVDVTAMLRDMWLTKIHHDEYGTMSEKDNFEFFLIDLADAFCHLPVRREELRHCVTKDEHDQHALVWVSMLFGYRAAPLLMGRLSAALGRLLQSMLNPQLTQIQVYIDDIIISCLGNLAWREVQLAAVLYTAAAFGVQISLKKGERGRKVQWIGCSLEVPEVEGQEDEVLIMGLSKQMIEQVVEPLQEWSKGGMAPLKELRTVTGRMSWIGGILPRLRWTVNVLYATLRDVEREQRDGVEDRRAFGREDQRSKKGLFAIKRLGGIHFWLLKLFEKPAEFLVRKEKLKRAKVTMGIITDASPKGWGAILVGVDPRPGISKDLVPLASAEALISENEAKLLGVKFGESSSQAVMEAYAILRAIDLWSQHLRGQVIMIRSDSSVALGMLRKLSSPHDSINFLAAEISLRLEKAQVPRMALHHLRGSWNKEADWLSRITERNNAEKPAGLKDVPLRRAAVWDESKFLLTPPGGDKSKPDRWTASHNVLEHLFWVKWGTSE